MSEMDIECSTDDDALSARFPVHRACRDGDVGALYSLLLHPTTTTTGGGVNHQEDLTTEDSCCEWTPIHWAAHFGKLECVVHLVRVGCDVNAATTRLAHTPVHTATFGGHPECVLWLLQAGADVNRQDYVGESPIHKAARAGSIECVRTLLIHGATPDLRSSSGLTAADLAYAQGFWDCFQLLSNAQNHLVQLSRSLAVGALTGSGVPHHGPLSGVGNRKRLVDELGSICIKKARTDNDPKGLFNGHRKPACAARNGHTGVPPQTTAPLDECTGTPSPRGPSAPAVVDAVGPRGPPALRTLPRVRRYGGGHHHLRDATIKASAAIAASASGGRPWTEPRGVDTGVKTYNSLTRRKDPLILTRDKVATWYSCGPTVYDHAHLGHACSYVRFDIVQRILTKVFGISVVHAMVITDIDDKIIKRSQEENMSPTILARIYEEEFKKDMLSLKVLPPAVYLRVTENVPQIVAFIERIVRNGHAYATQKGDVYFDIGSIGPRYGKLTGAVEQHSEATGDTDKRNTRDFALWKSSKPQEPSWASPWGEGRPGWHIECSTIASSVFGSQLDIHSGGIDLAFPHHENEIAQSEAYHQCEQWGNYFLHSGHLHLKGSAEKMSKSLKNYITIKDFLQSYSADEFRMFCLLTKYRSAIDFSDSSMSEARSILSTVVTFENGAQAYMRGQLLCHAAEEALLWEKLAETKARVVEALADDFDTPRAVHAIMNLVYHGNCQLQPVTEGDGSARSPAVFGAMLSYIRDVFGLLGVDLVDRQEAVSDSSANLETLVEQLCEFRSQVRTFALAPQEAPGAPGGSAPSKPRMHPDRGPLLQACDALRKDLAPMGVLIKDRGVTSTWEIARRTPAVSEKDREDSH
ncbi:hypothetical protein NHX12_015136 [Muraenolepis orangiensis]|uniref:Probable cysteine--tRNA ligase, mitochondrial n=1 Tax=Muraenolepis orangiensis TaxID=630683 RepID=A0A9Q0DBC2_9TELE|nr:hypothetical protein NHX12_015136 [Muraenolepis orangiensis]